MGIKSSIDYSPDKVAQGLRNLIAWETRVSPDVEVVTRLSGHEARVTIPADAVSKRRQKQLEKDFRDILPEGYTLNLTWT